MNEGTPRPDTKHALEKIERDGYCVLEDAIDPALLDAIDDAVHRIARDHGTVPANNDFEGRATNRVYNLLAHGAPFDAIPAHDAVLPVVEGVLDAGCLISSLSSIEIGPGEQAQPIHADDQLIALPRPHPAIVCNTMWAITDFTAENGATRIVPGSHRADHAPEYGVEFDSVPAEMRRGSVLVWNGSLWHGGGANATDAPRLGIAMNYCAGFIRQQENQQLGIPREVARSFSPRVQRLIGYGVYRALIGHIDKRDPIELLGQDGAMRTVWES